METEYSYGIIKMNNFIEIHTVDIEKLQLNVKALEAYIAIKKPWYRNARAFNKEISALKMLKDNLKSTLEYMKVNDYKYYVYGIRKEK